MVSPVLAVALFTSALAAQPTTAPVAPTLPPAMGWGECMLPPGLLGRLRGDNEQTLFADLMDWRRQNPALYGHHPPPTEPVFWQGEYTPRSALLLTWPEDRLLDPIALDIIRHAAPVVEVRVVVRSVAQAAARQAVRLAGIDLSRVVFIEAETDTVWMRDYGPVFVEQGGRTVAIDADYLVDCLEDEALPTRTYQRLGASAVLRSPVQMMGGSLLTDGAGTCFTTPALAEANGVTDWDADGGLRRWYGCQQVLSLPELTGGAIDHIDLMLSVAGPHTLLLGEADPERDPGNHAVLEEALAILQQARALDGRPYTIHRVPMVPLHRKARADRQATVRTWLNLVPLNDRVLVPSYDNVDINVQMKAWEAIGAAFAGRRVVPIQADAAAELYGAIRCLTVTVPAAPRPAGSPTP